MRRLAEERVLAFEPGRRFEVENLKRFARLLMALDEFEKAAVREVAEIAERHPDPKVKEQAGFARDHLKGFLKARKDASVVARSMLMTIGRLRDLPKGFVKKVEK